MSFSLTTCRNDYVGNGATATYTYGFKVFALSELKVYVQDLAGVVTTPAFSATGIGADAGGTITLSGGVLATGFKLTVRRVRALNQTSSVRDQGAGYRELLEDTFDMLAMNDSQQQDELDRSVKLPSTIASSAFDPTIPAGFAAPDMALVSDPTGTKLLAITRASLVGGAGTNGTNGTNGSVWRDGAGAPSNALGVNGDYYLNDTTGDVYLKSGGVYAIVTNIKGANGTSGSAGTPGSVWRSGSGAPSNGTGIDGDYYLNTANGDVYLRTAGTYSITANIKGPAGAGTVSSASVVSANGFAGTVANPTTTPAITLTTSVTGVLKGNGTAISAAASGTDYAPGTSALGTGIVKSTTATGALSIAVAGDFPTLNQNTTGTAANVTGTVAIANGGTGVTSVTTVPAVTAFAGWDANKNLSAANFLEGYATTVTAAGTTTLTAASNFLQFFTGTTTQTVVLPVASTLVLGQQFLITNRSTGIVTVQSSGANAIQAMAANTQLLVTCILTSGTTAASWDAIYASNALAAGGGGSTTSTQWASCALTYSAGFGTTTNESMWWRREGDSIHIRGYVKVGSVTAATATISGFPNSVLIDSAKIPGTGLARLGHGNIIFNGANVNIGSGNGPNTFPISYQGTTSSVALSYAGGSGVLQATNASTIMNSTDGIDIDILFPVQGWTNNN